MHVVDTLFHMTDILVRKYRIVLYNIYKFFDICKPYRTADRSRKSSLMLSTHKVYQFSSIHNLLMRNIKPVEGLTI